MENAQVAENGCSAVCNLGVDANNRKELGRVGACDAVVKALKKFGVENAQVAEKGCGAIWNLAYKNMMMTRQKNLVESAQVAKEGCDAIGNLGVDAYNAKELRRVGACDAVVKVLQD